MARHREIERRFLVETLPEGWKRGAASRVVQGYLPHGQPDLEIRLRRKGQRCCITFKAGQGANRFEEEIPINKDQFRSLWPLTRQARIAKRRYQVPCGPHTVEVDIYEGPHKGLITAEVEFDHPRQSARFQPPAWFGREVTGRG